MRLVPSPAASLKLSQPLHLNWTALVVSVHDVCPQTQAECEQIVTELAALGVKRCSLLVVPDYHGQGHSLTDLDFCAWLEDQVARGHEVVIHGYYHLRQSAGHESLRDQITTRVYTAGEGEFYDIDGETALALANQAREEFREVGFETEGFIAPAWLLNSAAEEALRSLGFQYTTRLQTVTDLQTGKIYRSQSLVWSVRSAWRRMTSMIWNAILLKGVRSNPLVRISIHPVDVHHPRVWRQIRRCVMRAFEQRAAFTYERWILRQRALEASNQTTIG